MYGLPYSRPAGAAALVEAMRVAFASGRSALVEVRTERSANRTLHGELVARVAAAVDAAVADGH
jgi:2-succinyl-5-enolpyruvyl-6-hydroxy-3-cyclohexene-1-carboxylate synthase